MHRTHQYIHISTRFKYNWPGSTATMAPLTDIIISTIIGFLQVIIGSLSLLQAYYMHQNLRLAISQTQKLDKEAGQISLPLPMPVPMPVPVSGRRPCLVRNVSSHLLYGTSLIQCALPQPLPPRRILHRQQTSPLLLTR